jgi:hypothetical protein
MNSVFVVFHTHDLSNGAEDVKMIGVFSSKERGESVISKLAEQPGFREFPSGFSIDEYAIDKEHWQEGFGGPDPT